MNKNLAFLLDDYEGADRAAAAEFLRTLPDTQALDGDDVRALAALAVAVDVPGSWYGDNAPAHALRDRIEGCIIDNCAQYVADAATLRDDLALARSCGANGLHALSCQYQPIPTPDEMDEAEARPIVIEAITARAADLRIPANLIGA